MACRYTASLRCGGSVAAHPSYVRGPDRAQDGNPLENWPSLMHASVWQILEGRIQTNLMLWPIHQTRRDDVEAIEFGLAYHIRVESSDHQNGIVSSNNSTHDSTYFIKTCCIAALVRACATRKNFVECAGGALRKRDHGESLYYTCSIRTSKQCHPRMRAPF